MFTVTGRLKDPAWLIMGCVANRHHHRIVAGLFLRIMAKHQAHAIRILFAWITSERFLTPNWSYDAS